MYCTQVGGTLYFYFATVDTAGEIANADSTPTATLYIDGVAQGTSPTLAHPPAVDGAYVGSFSLAGRSVGQAVAVLVTATVDGVEGNHWIIGGPITRDADGAVITDTASRDASKADISGLSTLTQQQVTDALKLSPTAGIPSTGSVNADLDTLIANQGNTGTGARAVTITVNDGTNPLENAVVRLTEGGNTYSATTNVSGQANFSLDDATYTVTISKANYQFTPTTILVNGTESETYSMTQISSSTPSLPTTCVCSIYIYNQNGVPISGQTIQYRMRKLSSSSTGKGYDGQWKTSGASDANGLIEIELVRQHEYELKWTINTANSNRVFTVPDADTYTLPSIIGPT